MGSQEDRWPELDDAPAFPTGISSPIDFNFRPDGFPSSPPLFQTPQQLHLLTNYDFQLPFPAQQHTQSSNASQQPFPGPQDYQPPNHTCDPFPNLMNADDLTHYKLDDIQTTTNDLKAEAVEAREERMADRQLLHEIHERQKQTFINPEELQELRECARENPQLRQQVQDLTTAMDNLYRDRQWAYDHGDQWQVKYNELKARWEVCVSAMAKKEEENTELHGQLQPLVDVAFEIHGRVPKDKLQSRLKAASGIKKDSKVKKGKKKPIELTREVFDGLDKALVPFEKPVDVGGNEVAPVQQLGMVIGGTRDENSFSMEVFRLGQDGQGRLVFIPIGVKSCKYSEVGAVGQVMQLALNILRNAGLRCETVKFEFQKEDLKLNAGPGLFFSIVPLHSDIEEWIAQVSEMDNLNQRPSPILKVFMFPGAHRLAAGRLVRELLLPVD